MGLLHALGYRFLNESGQTLTPSGAAMKRVRLIDGADVHLALKKTRFTVAFDVLSPL